MSDQGGNQNVGFLMTWVIYRKSPNFLTPKMFGVVTLQTKRLYHRVMHPKDADSIANSEDPDQTAPDLGLHYLPRPICPKT